jgi:hypothetical protein
MRRTIAAAIILATIAPAHAAPPSSLAECLTNNALIGARLFPQASSAELVRATVGKCRAPEPSPELHGFLEGLIVGYRIRGENPPELQQPH